MAKMSTEERHKKQLEKLQAKSEPEKKEYTREKTEKEKAIEELEKQGYIPTYESGVPMFNIKAQSDADAIRNKLQGKGSFGFRYPKDVEIE